MKTEMLNFYPYIYAYSYIALLFHLPVLSAKPVKMSCDEMQCIGQNMQQFCNDLSQENEVWVLILMYGYISVKSKSVSQEIISFFCCKFHCLDLQKFHNQYTNDLYLFCCCYWFVVFFLGGGGAFVF